MWTLASGSLLSPSYKDSRVVILSEARASARSEEPAVGGAYVTYDDRKRSHEGESGRLTPPIQSHHLGADGCVRLSVSLQSLRCWGRRVVARRAPRAPAAAAEQTPMSTQPARIASHPTPRPLLMGRRCVGRIAVR